MDIEQTAKFQVSLFYGDKQKCIDSLKKTITKYQNSINAKSQKIIERIEKYNSIVNYLEIN